jgi:integrase
MIRTRATFIDHIATKDSKTVLAYNNRIDNFERYCAEKHGRAEIINILKKDWPDILQLYINWLSKDHAPSTVWNYFTSIRKYLHYRGVRITKDDVEDELELPKKVEKEMHPLQLEEVNRIIGSFKDYHNKVLFMFQLASGVRIGELVQLRKKHFIFGKDRIMVKIPSKIAKFRRARTTFVTKETGIMLSSILKKKQDEELVFGTCDNVHAAESTKGDLLRRHLGTLGLDQKYEETGYHKINTHSFRAYFVTKASRSDANIAKKLAGEKGYLLQYDRLTDDELLEGYLKFEDSLLIFDKSVEKARLEKREIKQDATIAQLTAKVEFLLARQKMESPPENSTI